MKAVTQDNLRVRLSPSTILGVTLGVVLKGQTVNVVSVKNGWALVDLMAGGQPIFELGGAAPRYGYMSASHLKFIVDPPPPPPPTGKHNRLSVNVINYGRGAQEAVKLGAKAVLIMDHEDLAAEIARAHPDVFVMFRRYIHNWQLTGRQLADRLGVMYPEIGAYQLFNEADSWGYGDERAINIRIDHELEAARIVRSKNCGVMVGSYSMGTWDVTAPWANKAVSRIAPIYNTDERVYFDIHGYSPAMGRFYQPRSVMAHNNSMHRTSGRLGHKPVLREHPVATWYQDQPRAFTPSQSPLQNKPMDIWFERRWEWLFTHCGFDPRQRRVTISETGVDEGGIGGFPAHNATHSDFEHWVLNWLQTQAAPVVVDGVAYETPVLCAAIYQLGDGFNQSWDGYDIGAYKQELARLAWKR